MCRARCSLLVKLKWHGGKSVQKKRCPFFFFEGLFVSLVALSLSDPSLSSSSSSTSPISTSRGEATEWVDRWEFPWLRSLFVEGVSLSSRGGKGEEGSGRWPARLMKLLRVGVFADGSSAWTSSTPFASGKNLVFGRGVVGVVSPPLRPGAGSGTVRVVLTALKVDILCTTVVVCPFQLCYARYSSQVGTRAARWSTAAQRDAVDGRSLCGMVHTQISARYLR
jgi:hypothetical protein